MDTNGFVNSTVKKSDPISASGCFKQSEERAQRHPFALYFPGTGQQKKKSAKSVTEYTYNTVFQ